MRIRSGLGRPLDPSLPSNLFVLVATPLAGVAAGSWRLLAGDSFGGAIWGGVLGGGTAFLAWAVARELDPDRAATASLAALVAPWALLAGDPALFGGAVVLLGVRITAGTTGHRLYGADAVALASIALGSGSGGAGPIPGAFVAVAVLWLDHRTGRVAGPAIAIASFGGWALWGDGPSWADLAGGEWVIGAAAVLALGGMVRVRVTVDTDRGDVGVRPSRVRAARALAVGCVAGATAWFGGPGLLALSPALIGAATAGFPGRRSARPAPG